MFACLIIGLFFDDHTETVQQFGSEQQPNLIVGPISPYSGTFISATYLIHDRHNNSAAGPVDGYHLVKLNAGAYIY